MKQALWLMLLCAMPLSAATYNLSNGNYPPCSTNWSESGNSFRCDGNGRVTLNNGDIVLANAAATLIANNGFSLNGATIGSAATRINLQSDYGSINSTNTNLVWGNITASSAEITLNNTAVNGSISSSGSINLTGGSITGLVTSSNNTITTNGTDLSGGATARSGMTLTGGTLAGDFVMLSNNSMTLSGVTMQSGSISGASTVSIADSKIGSAGSMVNISSNSGAITLNASTVYGVLQAPGYSTVNVQGGSQVFGQCLPNSSPAGACTLYEPLQQAGAHYPLDLCAAVNNGVIADLTGNYPASGINVGAVADGRVLEAGDFSASGNDYISIPAAALNGLSNFSVSMWFRLDAGNGFRELFSASSNSSNTELELYINGNNEIRAGLKGAYYTFTGGSNSPVVANNVWSQVTLTRNGNQLCLYLNSNLVRCVTVSSSAGLSVARAAVGAWWQANGNLTDDFRGDIDEVLLFNQVLSQVQISQMYLNQSAGLSYDGTARSSACGQCLTDNFSAALSPDSWVTSRSSGDFTPQVVNGRLRMTEAVGNQATSATYQRLYPAADNLVIVEFDYRAYGGNGADGLALVLSDATITPQAGAFGGPLGYGFKPGIPGFAGGWLGFGLDEYGNFSNEGGSTNVGRRQQSVAVRGSGEGTTGYRYLRGTCNNGSTNPNGNCLSPAVDGNQNSPHRYRFTVDSRQPGTTLVSVERDSGSGFVSLIAPFNAQNQTGQAPVPANFFLSLTGSTGGSNNIHELDNLSICALRSAPVGQQIDHFEFDYSGRALTCNPETFTVRACKNAACSELITAAVTANLSPAIIPDGGWLGGNVINFSGGSTTVALRRSVAGSTTIGVSGSVPTTRPLSQTLCRAGNGALSAAACTISFADSGLVFDVPDGVANQSTQNILLSAVRKDDSSQQCVPQFANVSRNVAFWSDYVSPGAAGRPVSWPVQINNTDVGLTEATRQTLSLNFNAQGQASFNLNYADAGQLQLNARYTGSAATQDNGLVMNGADQFKRRPAGLCIQTGGECSAADADCPVFRRAGENFNLNISARAFAQNSTDICQNPVTPNFSRSDIAITHQLLAPANGNAGSLAVNQYQQQSAVNAATVVAQSVSEVGVFRFAVPALSYLGMAEPIPAAASAPTGRFIPQRFSLAAGSAIAACGSFTYFGQRGFSTAFTLQALNTAGMVTQNYRDAFARLDLSVWSDVTATQGMRYSAPDLPAGSVLGEGAISPLGSWQDGVAQMTVSHYASRPPQPAAPLDLTVYAQPTDTDGVSTDAISALHNDTTALRYGRLTMQNLAGPEDEPLPLVFATEYWDGSDFLLNAADSCTLISNSSALLTTISGSPDLSLIGNSTMVQSGRLPAQTLWLNPPSAVGTWQVQYETYPWLQYYWRGATPDYQQNPSAEVMFGRFRGNPRQISWRELFQ